MGSLEREKGYLYWLCSRVPGLGAVTVRRLGERFGSFEAAYYIEGTELERQGVFARRSQLQAYEQAKGELGRALEEYQSLGERGIGFVTPLDSEYPKRLRHIYDYPMGLWFKGKLPREDGPSVAVIGARSCTSYGEQVAEYMGRELCQAQVQIIGGLALGIDSAGHRGALKAGGETWGVLGCGINICYPKSNYPLYCQMLERGGVLSEYALSQPPRSGNFPVRNRLISALADVILVIEAKDKSGSLITARLGLDQGKEIFALPGRVTDALSAGCNHLIRDGAAILTSPGDVLEYLGITWGKEMILYEKSNKGLAKIEKMVYSCLDSEPKHVEEISARSGVGLSQCMGALMELELGGLAVKTTGQYYVRRMR